MIAAWMFQALCVGALVTAAALAAERGMRDLRLPTRWIWCAAPVLSLLVPLAVRAVPGRAAEPGLAAVGTAAGPLAFTIGEITAAAQQGLSLLERVEGLLLPGWAAASSLLLLLLGGSFLRLRAVRSGWRERELHGTPVLISSHVGPAVLGLFRHRIVLPAWVLAHGVEAREMILAHEREHVKARDPLLVVLGALPALLLPWHLPLWWQYRRLRLAVETDCDARVLARATPGERKRYGHLLLEVGRRNGGPLALTATFSEQRSLLGRRIRALSESAPAHPMRRALVLSAVGGLLVAAACLVPGPDGGGSLTEPLITEDYSDVAPPAPAIEGLAAAPAFTPMTVRPRILNVDEIQGEMARAYPSLLRDAGVGGTVQVDFFIDTDGRVKNAVVNRSSGQAQLDRAALRVAGVYRFLPARNRDEIVPVWVTFPVTFRIGGEAPEVVEGARSVLDGPASFLDRPASAARTSAAAGDLSERPAFTPMTERPRILNVSEVQREMQRSYPTILRDAGIGGTVQVDFFIDAEGRVGNVLISRSSGHAQLDEAALRVAATYRFAPAMNRDQAVPVWVTFPVTFRITPG
jgi:TonB family protein